MEHRVIISQVVSQAIGRVGLSRTALLKVLLALRYDLAILTDEYRMRNRHPEDPDFFTFRCMIASGDHWHQFDFAVNDTMTGSEIFMVDAVSHIFWPW